MSTNSKYTSFPDNSFFDKLLSSGEKLNDIFDGTDLISRCYSEDKNRPIRVRVGNKYNYVANGYLLFDNWFVWAREFQEDEEFTYAYRRLDAEGRIEGAVLLRRNGNYITREEFISVEYATHVESGKYAIVKQKNGLLNIIDLTTGLKAEEEGINADCIRYASLNYPDSGLFKVAIGNIKGLHDYEWDHLDEYADKGVKCNLYCFGQGILSPSMWFDYIESFTYYFDGYDYGMHKYAIVHLNGKLNVIKQNGHVLSERWFDVASVTVENEVIVGLLKSESLGYLRDLTEDFEYNPDKYELFKIDKYGRIKQLER